MLHRSMPRVLTSVFSAPRVAKPAGRASSSFGLLFQLVAAPSQASESGWPFSYMRATMTTIRQFMQTSPVKAMELFTKLLDTSDNAIKTRERLFGRGADGNLPLSLTPRVPGRSNCPGSWEHRVDVGEQPAAHSTFDDSRERSDGECRCRKGGPSEASRVGLITKRPSSLLGRFAHETTGRRAARDDVCLLDEAFA